MKVRFWGVRGSVATPGADFARYGGNTSCVEIETASGTRIIFDAGTGLRLLGDRLQREFDGPIRAHLFLTHTHWDHIQGLPFFRPASDPRNEITIYAAHGLQRPLEDLLRRQRENACRLVGDSLEPPGLRYQGISEGDYLVDGVEITAQYLNHTTLTLGYRLKLGGITVVYASDHEQFGRSVWRPELGAGRPTQADAIHEGDRLHIELARDADLLIHDAQYTAESYPKKIGWGHSTIEYASEIAMASGARLLMLYHHEPVHNDLTIDRLTAEAQDRVRGLGGRLDIEAAAEGIELNMREAGAGLDETAVRPKGEVGFTPRILIADDSAVVLRQLEDLLVEDGYEVTRASDGEEAVKSALAQPPDMLILDMVMPKMDGFAVCRNLRAHPVTEDLPIIAITALENPEDMAKGFSAGVNDYLLKPIVPAQLRARIRQWLLRAVEDS